MIRASDVLRAIFVPLTELSVLLPLLMFWGLVTLGLYRLPFGILVLILSLPPLFRYQSFVVEACASGKKPGAFDAEYFNWVGTGWTLFPLLLAIVLACVGFLAGSAWGTKGIWVVIVLSSIILPASLAVLAITHSALQALNPLAFFRVFEQAGTQFIIAPVYVLLLAWLTLESGSLPLWAFVFLGIFLMFSVAALTGTLVAPSRLIDNVYIPENLEPDGRKITGDQHKQRESALAHAYGFISRDNREGGFRHLFSAIEDEADPAAAWDWYLRAMFLWENKIHALFFAQHYIRDALAHGEDVRALKAAMRCYHENEQFRPLPENIAALIEIAERTGNNELAEVLKHG
jgi:hypothetical protein